MVAPRLFWWTKSRRRRRAADSGFASPSHLSETFRRTFGLSLTALLGSQVELDVQ
jgi:AraC-like DNA-binding protein